MTKEQQLATIQNDIDGLRFVIQGAVNYIKPYDFHPAMQKALGELQVAQQVITKLTADIEVVTGPLPHTG